MPHPIGQTKKAASEIFSRDRRWVGYEYDKRRAVWDGLIYCSKRHDESFTAAADSRDRFLFDITAFANAAAYTI